MTIICRDEIKNYLYQGLIEISDFDESRLNLASYNVRLGEWAAFECKETDLGFWTYKIDKNLKMVPDITYLVSTMERVGSHVMGINAEMKARSTTARNGISVTNDSGYGDPGFVNYWTMELQCSYPVAIPVGTEIAQIVFHRTSGDLSTVVKHKGNYQEQTLPYCMIPKVNFAL